MAETLLTKLNEYPPCALRILARSKSGYDPVTNADLAKRSGLSESRVAQISHFKKWDDLPIKTAVAYAMACGFNLLQIRTGIYRKVRRNKCHLKRLTPIGRRMYSKLIKCLSD